MKHIKFFLLFLCTLCVWQIKAQGTGSVTTVDQWNCGIDNAMMAQLSTDTGFVNRMARYNNDIQSVGGNQVQSVGPYIVPVVFHVIENGPTSAITYAQIKWQLAEINAAFNKQLQLFTGNPAGPRAVNNQIEFRLACVAQNCSNSWSVFSEPGVMRYFNVSNSTILNQDLTSTSTMTNSAAPMLALTNGCSGVYSNTVFPKNKYLNIYCVPNISPNGVIAYGTFPWLGLNIDGVVIRKDAVGSNYYPTNFPLIPALDKGSVLAHEFGHYLGLYHTFQPTPLTGTLSCYGTTTLNATTDGDMILDTPPTLIANDLGNFTSINSCHETNLPYGGLADENDQLENIMCYSDDDKLNTFTQGQANRMVAFFTTVSSPRYTLNTTANLLATGVNPNSCSNLTGILTGIFNYSIALGSGCASVNIQFTNPTSIGFTATSWSWTFGDGQTGTGANPLHTYAIATPTTFIATCVATNSTGATSSFSQAVNANFSASIVGQSGTTVCRGTEQTIFLNFGANVPSVALTDCTSTVTVYNNMDMSVSHDQPYNFIANSSASYSLVPVNCYTNSATFIVTDCCNNLITNGDFENGSTGFAVSPYHQTIITTFASIYGSPITPNTGNCYFGGFSGGGTPVIPEGCSSSTLTPFVWQQTLSGLQQSTTYFYSFKISEGYTNTPSAIPATATLSTCRDMNFATKIYNGTTLLLQSGTLVPVRYIASGVNPNSQISYLVYTYTFTTPPTITTATNFSVEINQVNNFVVHNWDFAIDNITLNAMTPRIQAIGSQTLCGAGQTAQLGVVANCAANLSNYNLTWTPAIGLSSTTSTNPIASPTVTTVYTLVATPTTTNASTPPSISTVTISIGTTPTITSITSACPLNTMTLTATGATNYTWSPSGITTNSIVVSPTVSTIYTLTSIGSYGCRNSITYSVNPISCCSVGAQTNIPTSGNLTGTYSLNGTLVLTGNLSIVSARIYMGSNAEIVVPNNMILTVANSHLLSCSNMWKGIRCLGPNATISINKGALIEDAITAVDLTNVTAPTTGQSQILVTNDATFNKNYIAINVNTYTNTAGVYPTDILNTVFTSRKLITPEHVVVTPSLTVTYNWPTANNMSNLKPFTTPIAVGSLVTINPDVTLHTTDQFTVATYPSANCEIPKQMNTALTGINVQYVYNTSAYAGFEIGTNALYNTLTTLNLFDNLCFGINALTSNIKSSNAAYQAMHQQITGVKIGKGGGTYYDANSGVGINALNTIILTTPSYSITVKPTTTGFNTSSNFFINNAFNIKATNYEYFDAQYQMAHSSRVYSYVDPALAYIIPPALSAGSYGIFIKSLDYRNINITNNFMANISNAAVILGDAAGFQVVGTVNVLNNSLKANYGTSLTTQSMNQAIAIDNTLTPGTTYYNGLLITIAGNTIDKAFNGIHTSNWNTQRIIDNTNTITLVDDNSYSGLFGANTQTGILHQNNTSDNMINNTITGFGTTKANVYSILAADNHAQAMLCNSTSNTYEGVRFGGSVNLTTWQSNNMQTHVRGMHLYNTVIGQQGAVNVPIDNKWNGTWNVSNLQTYVTTSLTATGATNSAIYVKNVAPYKPTFNNALNSGTEYKAVTPVSIFIATGSGYNCLSIGTGTDCIGCGGGGSTLPAAQVQAVTLSTARALTQVVTDSVAYTTYPTTMRLNAKQSAHRYMKQHSNVLFGNVALQNFNNAYNAGNVAALENVETALATGSITVAKNLNASINPQNVIETNTKLFYDLYTKCKQNTALDSTDASRLLALAKGCPERDGLVVYQARVLHNSINNRYQLFQSNCTTASSARLGNTKADVNNPIVPEYNTIDVYPNPNTGNAIINLKDAGITSMTLKIYDVNGRVVFEDKVTDVSDKNYELTIDVKSGIYFVEVIDTNTETYYKQKLVIQK